MWLLITFFPYIRSVRKLQHRVIKVGKQSSRRIQRSSYRPASMVQFQSRSRAHFRRRPRAKMAWHFRKHPRTIRRKTRRRPTSFTWKSILWVKKTDFYYLPNESMKRRQRNWFKIERLDNPLTVFNYIDDGFCHGDMMDNEREIYAKIIQYTARLLSHQLFMFNNADIECMLLICAHECRHFIFVSLFECCFAKNISISTLLFALAISRKYAEHSGN